MSFIDQLTSIRGKLSGFENLNDEKVFEKSEELNQITAVFQDVMSKISEEKVTVEINEIIIMNEITVGVGKLYDQVSTHIATQTEELRRLVRNIKC